tara:strand:- start:3069 stop:3839 length:771 start_codon:yes stop_codon:yes gene_type:complete
MALKDLIDARERLIDSMEDSLRRQLEAVRERFIGSIPSNVETLRDADFVFRLLLDSGYAGIIDGLPYDARLQAVTSIASETGVDLSKVSTAPIDALRTSNQALIAAHSRAAAERIRASLLFASLSPTPVPFGEIVSSVRAAFDSAVFSQGQLETQVNTAMAAWDRQLMDEIAEQADVSLWVYMGPSDKLTRPFCRDLLQKGKAYTERGIQELNGHPSLHGYIPPNVKVYCGGYNCRHMFSPVSDRWAEKNGYKAEG